MKKLKKIMSKYTKPFWAVKQIVRETGLVEDVCECGEGHPNIEFLRLHPNYSGIHGCDGCCRQGINNNMKKSKNKSTNFKQNEID